MLAPSDFSALKNFVWKPVHENRSKFFQSFKITSNQLTVNDVICAVVFVNNNTANSLLMNFDCPVDMTYLNVHAPSSSKTARQHTQLVPRRTGSKPTAQISLPKTNGLQIHPTWIPWITMSGGKCWRPITSAIRNRKRSPNWKNSCRWSGTAYLKDQSCQKEFSKRLKACVVAEGGHFEYSQ